jgi:hypothetical protein
MLTVWFGDKKKAKTAALVMGLPAIAMLVVALFILVQYNITMTRSEIVVGTPTERHQSAGEVWTEFDYHCHGEDYKTRIDGVYFPTEKELLCNPQNPSDIKIHSYPPLTSELLFYPGALFGVFGLLYLINFLVVARRDRKLNEYS